MVGPGCRRLSFCVAAEWPREFLGIVSWCVGLVALIGSGPLVDGLGVLFRLVCTL